MISSKAQFICGAVLPKHYPRRILPEVAFLGRSNVGKSSLINSLLRVKGLARTSNTPGRTQQINFFCINDSCYFVDLPGYGYARVPGEIRAQWGPMVETYLSKRPIVLGILIVDVRHDPLPIDEQMLSWLKLNAITYCIVATKSDKLSNNQLSNSIRKLKIKFGPDIISYSSVTRKGSDELWKLINNQIKSFDKKQEILFV